MSSCLKPVTSSVSRIMWQDSPGLLPPFLRTTSDQKLEPEKPWKQGYFPGLPTIQIQITCSKQNGGGREDLGALFCTCISSPCTTHGNFFTLRTFRTPTHESTLHKKASNALICLRVLLPLCLPRSNINLGSGKAWEQGYIVAW